MAIITFPPDDLNCLLIRSVACDRQLNTEPWTNMTSRDILFCKYGYYDNLRFVSKMIAFSACLPTFHFYGPALIEIALSSSNKKLSCCYKKIYTFMHLCFRLFNITDHTPMRSKRRNTSFLILLFCN